MLSPSDERIADHYADVVANWTEADLRGPVSKLVSTYLLTSFVYYQMNESLISDSAYDQLCKTLLARYAEIKDNPRVWHRNLVTEDSLRAGTLFNLKSGDYPTLIADIGMELQHRLSNVV